MSKPDTMKTVDEIRKKVNQFANIAGLDAINVLDMQEDESHERPAMMRVVWVHAPLYHFRVSRDFYDLGQISQRECLIELVAEALYFQENTLQYLEMARQRKNDPDFTTSQLDELTQELKS